MKPNELTKLALVPSPSAGIHHGVTDSVNIRGGLDFNLETPVAQ